MEDAKCHVIHGNYVFLIEWITDAYNYFITQL